MGCCSFRDASVQMHAWCSLRVIKTAMIGIRGLAIAAALSLAGALASYAHAHLDRAAPAAGATVATAPSEVTLHFTERLEPLFSAVVVRDAAGQQVDKRDARVDEADRNILRVSLQPLGPGQYKVEWRVISVDTHASKGDYSFRIGR
jgi:methionine-rich copper-binding protein CopC